MQITRTFQKSKGRRKALWTTLPGAAVESTVSKRGRREIRRSKVKPVSDRMRSARAQYTRVKVEWLRKFHAQGKCEACGKKAGPLDVHHTRGRAGTLLTDWRHWRAVCRRCHNWIAENPVDARSRGLLCEAGKWNVPDRTPTPSI